MDFIFLFIMFGNLVYAIAGFSQAYIQDGQDKKRLGILGLSFVSLVMFVLMFQLFLNTYIPLIK